MQTDDSCGLDVVDLEEPLGVVVAVLVAQPEAALGDQADAAPLAVADLEDVVDQPPRPGLPSRRTARAYGFSTSARPASSCRTVRQDAFEQVERLEAGDHDRHADSGGRSARTRS